MLLTSEVKEYINGLHPTNHVILFYDTLESKRRILNEYIADGLENNKGILYICSEETPEQIREWIRSEGIDIRGNEETGRLQIKYYDQWYIENGTVEPLRIINRWREAHAAMEEMGLGLRVTGETSCFFEERKVRELLRYEYALHRVLSIPIEAICAYSVPKIVNTGYTDMIMPLVRAHGGAIFAAGGGAMIMEPENVEDHDVEELLNIKV